MNWEGLGLGQQERWCMERRWRPREGGNSRAGVQSFSRAKLIARSGAFRLPSCFWLRSSSTSQLPAPPTPAAWPLGREGTKPCLVRGGGRWDRSTHWTHWGSSTQAAGISAPSSSIGKDSKVHSGTFQRPLGSLSHPRANQGLNMGFPASQIQSSKRKI